VGPCCCSYDLVVWCGVWWCDTVWVAIGGAAGVAVGGDTRWDFFVSYAQADRGWAEWIAWTLEDAGFRVLIQAWDFVPGSNWVSGLEEGISRAARTIVVLSQDYVGSVFGQVEWRAAWAADPNGAARALVVVKVRDCGVSGLLAQVVPLDLVGRAEEQARSELVDAARRAISGERAKPSTAPPFPAQERALPARPSYPDSAVPRPVPTGPSPAPNDAARSEASPMAELPRADGPATGAGHLTLEVSTSTVCRSVLTPPGPGGHPSVGGS